MRQKTFLERLQEAPESAKRKTTVLVSAIVMVAVIFVWLTYFNNLLRDTKSQPVPEIQGSESFTFFHTMQNGLAVILDSFVSGIRGIGNVFVGGRSSTVTPEH
ncbi:MAG: hypothetical protein AAB652_00145 [Patescibacteria group bacterium]